MRTISLRRSAIILFVVTAPLAFFLPSVPLTLVAIALAVVALLDLRIVRQR